MPFRLPEDGALLVDFDGTLLNRCSTELYLSCASPAPLAGLVLWLVDGLKPWRLLPRPKADAPQAGSPKSELIWRDWIRVLLVTLLFPWTPWVYRCRVAAFAEAWTNRTLIGALREAGEERITIVTHGFRFIVAPLVAAMGLDWRLVAAPLVSAPLHRRRGKAEATRTRIGTEALSTATVITDTPNDDDDLIALSRESRIITPPEGWFKRAHASAYRPFAYISEAKHPGHRHLLRVFIGEDWLVLVLAGALPGPSPLLAALGLLLLVLAFFIVYEQGYYENDHRVQAFREPDPFLTNAQKTWSGTMSAPWAWTFALGLSLPGVALIAAVHAADARWWPTALPEPTTSFPIAVLGMLASWITLLVGSRLLFALFNRVTPQARVLLFPLLQAVKGIGIAWAVMLPIGHFGAALLLGQMVSRWIPYAIYRMNGPRWVTPDQTIRLIVTVTGALALVLGPAELSPFHWSGIPILLWCTFKARKEIRGMVRGG
jgi:phosphoserine phosphatase